MSDLPAPSAEPAIVVSAGGLLRQARQMRGLHIAALAAAIKVTPRKLELLESDQYDQLTDATFVRALAQTVCRTLKIDAAPVLTLLPSAPGNRLQRVGDGLNTPFRERPGRLVPKEWATTASPAVWIAALLVIAAFAIYLLPAGWLQFAKPSAAGGASQRLGSAVGEASGAASSPAAVLGSSVSSDGPAGPVAESASQAASASRASPDTPATGAAPVDAAASANAGVFPPDGPGDNDEAVQAAATELLQLHASGQSWIEITDAHGQSLIARVIEPGENVGIDGVLPLKLKIGNARAMEVVFRGRPMALGAFTRDNVARLELK